MKAIAIIRYMNETGKRKVPEGAPLNFVSNRWQKHVYDNDGIINRHYYEMAVFTELRNYIRSGDVSIVAAVSIKTSMNTWFRKKNGHESNPALEQLSPEE
jgi:hypothetical protein